MADQKTRTKIKIGWLDETYGYATTDGDTIAYSGPKAEIVQELVEGYQHADIMAGKTPDELLALLPTLLRSYCWAALVA